MPVADGPPGPFYAGEAAELDDADLIRILGFDLNDVCEPELPQAPDGDLTNSGHR